jgi:hypothetical protein
MPLTDAERETAFQVYLEHSIPYFEAVEANGGTPWFSSTDERRALFMQRYTRPDPPISIPPAR